MMSDLVLSTFTHEYIPKQETHIKGVQHFAFSVMIYNQYGRCFYNKGLFRNIILEDYGVMLVVGTQLVLMILHRYVRRQKTVFKRRWEHYIIDLQIYMQI